MIHLVEQFGAEKWSSIASYLPGRIGKQCRERWFNHLNPNVKKAHWLKEEEWILFLKHKQYGNHWSKLTHYLPGRTDNTIKNHWNSTMKKKISEFEIEYSQMIRDKTSDEIDFITNNFIDKCNTFIKEENQKFYNDKLKHYEMFKNSNTNTTNIKKLKKLLNFRTHSKKTKKRGRKPKHTQFAFLSTSISTPIKHNKEIQYNRKLSLNTKTPDITTTMDKSTAECTRIKLNSNSKCNNKSKKTKTITHCLLNGTSPFKQNNNCNSNYDYSESNKIICSCDKDDSFKKAIAPLFSENNNKTPNKYYNNYYINENSATLKKEIFFPITASNKKINVECSNVKPYMYCFYDNQSANKSINETPLYCCTKRINYTSDKKLSSTNLDKVFFSVIQTSNNNNNNNLN